MISRGNIRRQYGIKGNDCSDCLTSCFCGCCALVQEDREVKAQEKEDGKYAAPGAAATDDVYAAAVAIGMKA